jgi:SAM-dependent methyltransferase
VEALLDACVALRILRRHPQGYENTRTSKVFLQPGREASFAPVLQLWKRLGYETWGRLGARLKEGHPGPGDDSGRRDVFERIEENEEQLRLFCDGLGGLAYWPAQKLAAIVDFSQRTHLLDLGGGSGVFGAVIGRRYPHLRVTLFDRPLVCPLAAERFRRMDAGDRFHTIAGDFFRDPLPDGCDAVLLSHVLHDWSAEECVGLLRKVHDVLPEGGEIIVHDFMPDSRGVSPEASLFELTLVLDTPQGRVYTLPEIRELLEEVGFQGLRHRAVVGGTSLVTAVKGHSHPRASEVG